MVEMCKFSFKMTGQLAVPPEGQTKIKMIVIIIKKERKKNVHKKESTGGAYEKPKNASAASLTLAVMRILSGDWPMELGTGSSVNSGSKCLRSLGPLCVRGRKGKMQHLDPKCFVSAQFNSKGGKAPLCRDSECCHLRPIV